MTSSTSSLNLKYLEATFYSFITTGGDLPSSSTVSSGAVTGAPGKLVFTGSNAQQITDMLNEIYFDEKSHVATLISLLGSSYAFRPAINLGAYAAITATNALSIARLLEDVGATAYAGRVGCSDQQQSHPRLADSRYRRLPRRSLRLVSIQNPTIAAYAKADSLDVLPADVVAVVPRCWPRRYRGLLRHRRGNHVQRDNSRRAGLHAHILAGPRDCLRQQRNSCRIRRYVRRVLPQRSHRQYQDRLILPRHSTFKPMPAPQFQL